MGMRDAYPFAVADRVIEKLTFVHEICSHATLDGALRGAQGAPVAANTNSAQLH
jgi:hypothetical protein